MPETLLPTGNSPRTIEAWVNTTQTGTEGIAGYGNAATRSMFALRRNGTNHLDQLGSVRAMTDSGGGVTQTYQYDPYGNIVSSTGTVSNPFQFAGQYVAGESSLVYLRNR